MSATVSEEERMLHAFVDGELDGAGRLELEKRLQSSPELRARVADYARISRGLKALYDPIADERIPPRLLESRPTRRWTRFGQAAALLVAVALGGFGGWWARGIHQGESPDGDVAGELAAEAIVAHEVYTPEVRHPVEVRGSEQHLLPWLSKRLGMAVRAPSLEALGYRLLGGRLLPWRHGTSAQLMYERFDGRRITVYLTHSLDSDTATAFRFAERGGLSAFYWLDGDYGCALVGDVEREELSRAAHVVYEAMELGHS